MPARRPKPLPGEKKSDTTKRVLLERALALFQKRGVEATTMRDIARAAGMSLGAAYYYFSSKEDLIFAYYEENQREIERVVLPEGRDVRARLGALFHAKLESLAPQKKMMASIVQRLIDPADQVSAFSTKSASVRAKAIALIDAALEGSVVPAVMRPMAAQALWLMQMAMLLVFVRDGSPGEKNTHRFVDDALDMVVPLLPLLATPMGTQLAQRIVDALSRAGIVDRDTVGV
ncbi:MAG TPA: TetR/AcrR family transcriptional regulator [Kofleriaceae bacterium]|jgi:AcrR family transcriptional regulator